MNGYLWLLFCLLWLTKLSIFFVLDLELPKRKSVPKTPYTIGFDLQQVVPSIGETKKEAAAKTTAVSKRHKKAKIFAWNSWHLRRCRYPGYYCCWVASIKRAHDIRESSPPRAIVKTKSILQGRQRRLYSCFELRNDREWHWANLNQAIISRRDAEVSKVEMVHHYRARKRVEAKAQQPSTTASIKMLFKRIWMKQHFKYISNPFIVIF